MKEEIQNIDEKSTKKRKGKSLRKIKKEHKISLKEENKKVKKLSKKQKHIAKKYGQEFSKKGEPKDVFADVFLNEETNEFEKKSINTSSGKTKQEKVLIVRKAKAEPMTKKRKIMNLLSYVLVGVFAIGFGYVAGNFYYANCMDKPNYNFNTSELRDNGEEIYNRIKNQAIGTQNPIEVIVGAEYLLNQQTKYVGTVTGMVKPSIGTNQTVRGVKGRDGNHFYVENYSNGILPIAEKYDYDSDADVANVYRVEGKGKVSENSANFKDTPTWIFNRESFMEEYGIAPDGLIIPYIISSKTVIDGTAKIQSLGGGKYQVSMQLLKDKSVADYVKQVKHMSGFSDYPNFKSVRVSFVIDSSYRILSVRYDETYSVIYGLVVNCSAWLEITMDYD